MANETSEEKHELIMTNHNDLLISISKDVQEVKFILAGNKLNGYTGMVKDVSELKEDVAELKEWKNSVQANEVKEGEGVKKNHSAWAIAAAWLAAIASFAMMVFSMHKK